MRIQTGTSFYFAPVEIDKSYKDWVALIRTKNC